VLSACPVGPVGATRCLTAANLSSREERAAGQNRSGDAERAHHRPDRTHSGRVQPFVVVEAVVTRRILITGSRNWNHRPTIRAALAQVWHPLAVLVSGACPRGADSLCEACWEHWGGGVERHPAQWRTRGVLDRSAGFRRNEAMIALGADVCLAFIVDGSAGATHTATLARKALIPTIVYRATTGTTFITRHHYPAPGSARVHARAA